MKETLGYHLQSKRKEKTKSSWTTQLSGIHRNQEIDSRRKTKVVTMFKKNGSLEFVYICFEHVALRDYNRDNSWHFLRRKILCLVVFIALQNWMSRFTFKTFLDICERKKKKKRAPSSCWYSFYLMTLVRTSLRPRISIRFLLNPEI